MTKQTDINIDIYTSQSELIKRAINEHLPNCTVKETILLQDFLLKIQDTEK